MTASTVKVKKRGPIRWEAVIPVAVLTALLGLYFSLFFDGHIRRALEYVGTQINGAEVNIGRLSTSFLGARLEIDNIQITDKNKPERNIVQVGAIRFELLWDALLRAKVVVNEAAILEIQALSKRARPGYVVPPPPPSSGPTLLQKAQDQVLAQTKKRFSDNFLGDVAALIGGTDPKEQLKNLQDQLKSDARLKELEREFKEKSAKWQQKIKELPKSEELKAYEDRIKALKFDIGKPAELAASLKEADKIIKEIDQKVKLVDQTSKDVKSDIGAYNQAFKDLEKMIEADIKDLQTRLKLPNVDGKEFSQQLFMQMIEQRLVGVRKYVEVAREYMPPKKSAEELEARKNEQLVPRPRGQGKNIRFPITTGYPAFWLKRAAISSEAGSSEYGGNIKGEIKDFTTDPAFVQRPAVIQLAGDFPKPAIEGVDVNITLDHRTEQARDTMTVSVASFPLGFTKLADSPDIRLGLAEARGATVMNASLVDEAMAVDIKSQFSSVRYDLEAKNKIVQELLGNILRGIPNVTLNARVSGSFSDFDVHINSNLGDELARGFAKQLQAKIDEAKAQLRGLIDARIGSERNKLKADLDKTTGGLTKDLDGKKSEIDKAIRDAKNFLESEKGKGQGKKLEEEGKKLLKKLKIGG